MPDDLRVPLLYSGGAEALPARWPLLRTLLALAAAAALLLAGGLLAVALWPAACGRTAHLLPAGRWRGSPPCCRKSASVAVLPGADGSLHLLVWAGIGLHKSIFPDLHALDLRSLAWRQLDTAPGHSPVPRWKDGGAVALPDGGGMLVVGGDAYWPGTLRHKYTNDIWRLSYPELEWQQAAVDASAPAPARRRGHSTMLYVDAASGEARVVIFGGRTRDKVPLNDCWEATLSWPNATWRHLTPQAPGAPDVPAPRRGHSAVPVTGDAARPQMLVYGGREEDRYFSDTWILDLAARRWRRLEPASEAPQGRDHHAAMVHAGHFYAFGGRTGSSYSESSPTNELWRLSLASRTWELVAQAAGPHGLPLPRFEHSFAQATLPGSNDSQLLVFGGQESTGKRRPCQMNDVWALSLDSLTWRQLSAPRWCTRRCRRAHSG